MREHQKHIYYITGENIDAVKKSPFVERVISKGFEVIYMTEPINEFCMQHLNEYNGKKMILVTKEGLELDIDNDDEKQINYTILCTTIKDFLGNKIEKVYLTNRLVSSPCCIVSSQHGLSANMERIMKAQALHNTSHMDYMTGKKNFELNSTHPIIQTFLKKVKKDNNNKTVKDIIMLMYETAMLSSGFTLDDMSNHSDCIYHMIKLGLQIDDTELPNTNPTEINEPITIKTLESTTNMENID